ncbi:hypothetical protein [Desulfurella sp.]|uniref:hypothetical protein n=1 Tax=Desulfurella sp. TaxID=1962857 RepID=UPI00257B3F20|nr:hypothetical protein [Desulfurella sp.]
MRKIRLPIITVVVVFFLVSCASLQTNQGKYQILNTINAAYAMLTSANTITENLYQNGKITLQQRQQIGEVSKALRLNLDAALNDYTKGYYQNAQSIALFVISNATTLLTQLNNNGKIDLSKIKTIDNIGGNQ